MTDDLDFVRSHISDYRGYGDEAARHDSDQRVRAYVGEAVSQSQTRLAGKLDAATQKALDEVLMRCMFADQVFTRKIQHARLDSPMIAAFVLSDRRLIEAGEKVAGATPDSIRDLLVDLDKLFEYRRDPAPV